MWNKIISFDMKKKRKSKIGHKKNEEKGEFESLGVSILCSRGGTPIVL
jgi:hypothetical protein